MMMRENCCRRSISKSIRQVEGRDKVFGSSGWVAGAVVQLKLCPKVAVVGSECLSMPVVEKERRSSLPQIARQNATVNFKTSPSQLQQHFRHSESTP